METPILSRSAWDPNQRENNYCSTFWSGGILAITVINSWVSEPKAARAMIDPSACTEESDRSEAKRVMTGR